MIFKFILFAVAIYFVLKAVARFFLPKALKDLEKKMRNQNNNYHSNKREGEVTIQQDRRKEKSISKDIGEYIDFEELKEKK